MEEILLNNFYAVERMTQWGCLEIHEIKNIGVREGLFLRMEMKNLLEVRENFGNW